MKIGNGQEIILEPIAHVVTYNIAGCTEIKRIPISFVPFSVRNLHRKRSENRRTNDFVEQTSGNFSSFSGHENSIEKS